MNTSRSESLMEPGVGEDSGSAGDGKSFYEKVKGVASKGYEMAGKVLDMNSHADWVEGKWEKFKNVSSEWMKDVAETVRMKTTDKWKFMSEQKNTNKLIAHKEEDIKNLGYMGENEERNIQSFESGRSSDLEKFNSALDSIKDPHIKEIFERNRDEKVDAWNTRIDASRNTIEGIGARKIQYVSEIVNFRKDIEEAGEDFSGKIDSRIDNIREKCGYGEKKDQLESLNNQIEDGYDNLKTTKAKIAEYKSALDIAEKIGVSSADLRTLEDGIDEMESEREHIEHKIDQAVLAEERLKKAIAKIDEKTAKWEKMRKKLGLVNNNATDSDTSHDNFEREDDEDEADNNGTVAREQTQSRDDFTYDEDPVFKEEEQNSDRDLNRESVVEDNREDDRQKNRENESDEEYEGGVEDVGVMEKKEAVEKLGESFGNLYKSINNEEKTAKQIMDEVMKVRSVISGYSEVFPADEYTKLRGGIEKVRNDYHAEGIELATSAVAVQIKKDVFNKILRKLPDWINI